ncbi:MAG TPA: phosphotransferase [Usitatibacter sp.]|nr:phosphotransferase [Usitatibacter sp.]
MSGNFDKFTGTRPVAPQHAFDAGRLAAWMREHVDESIRELSVAQFKGGQSNPTYLVDDGKRRYALRRKPPGQLLPSAHAVDREYRVMKALAATDVPVPKMYALCEDTEVIGTAFFLGEYVQGRVLWDPTLPELTNAQRATHYEELNRVIAALHSVDYAAIGLGDFGKPGSYLARQVDRWTRQYRASETEKIDAMDRLIEWLPGNIPPGEDTSIVHGDYRIDNVIYHPTEPRILAVLDWELSTLGHPLADFAYHCMTWRMPEGAHGRGLAGVDLASLGIPTEKEYVAMYCRRTGRADGIPHFDYYVAFNMFRLAAILQGVMKRALQGNAASAEAHAAGARTRAIAEEGWRQAERVQTRH